MTCSSNDAPHSPPLPSLIDNSSLPSLKLKPIECEERHRAWAGLMMLYIIQFAILGNPTASMSFLQNDVRLPADADQFCIYKISNGASTRSVAIDDKAPHKLEPDDVITGLASKIQPERDVE